MNICKYIIDNNIDHIKLSNGKIKQKSDLILRYKDITSLNGFIQNGYLNLGDNDITSLEGFIQNGALNLSNNNITSLEGFIQNGRLYLSNNKITNLEGFTQNGLLNLRNNNITSLEGFIQNGYLVLCKWQISIQYNNLINIGCETNNVEEWDIFFKNKESYLTDSNSDDYKEIERVFKLYKKLIK